MMKRAIEIVFIHMPAAFLLCSVIWVLTYRYIPIRWTPLMLVRTIENAGSGDYVNRQIWIPMDKISPVIKEAVLLTEDQRFYSHHGFDMTELRQMMDRIQTDHRHAVRGCSTISQQVAKNCFTFGRRTLWRKTFEAYYTVLIEILWGKERILEVYMNVAETGRGLFGVEAACRKYYGYSATDISISEAAALACILPKPLARTPSTVMSMHAHRHAQMAREIGQRFR